MQTEVNHIKRQLEWLIFLFISYFKFLLIKNCVCSVLPPGIPATLTYINLDQTLSGSPELIPYPDWRSNAVGDCDNGLNTVYRIKADKCGRLWVLDTGTIGIGNTTQQVCPYAVNVFDLRTNERIRRYEFRPEDTNPNTFIANTIVDIGKTCDDTFAYFSDELGYGLVAYSWEQNKSWRFGHSFFFPDPLRGDFNVAGLNFQWGEEGIFGMALSPIKSDGYRTLFFSPLASHREFTVSTRILRDASRVEDSFHDFSYMEERSANGHTTARVMSDDGIMLFNLIDQNSVGCWHSSMPYSPQFHGIVDRDDVGLVFPAEVVIDHEQTVWVLSDRMPVFLIAELDYSDVNFRIYSAPLRDLVDGTVCDLSKKPGHSRFGGYGSVPVPQPKLQTKLNIIPVGLGGYKTSINNNDHISQQPLLSGAYDVHESKSSIHAVPHHHHHYSSLHSTTQRAPKTFAYTQHNGVSFDASGSPHEFTTGDHALPKASWWSRQLW